MKTHHDWTGPGRGNVHVHCSRCGKIFEISKAKGECLPTIDDLVTRLRAAGRDERLSTGALYLEAAAALEEKTKDNS
jgi:hypothetical protein